MLQIGEWFWIDPCFVLDWRIGCWISELVDDWQRIGRLVYNWDWIGRMKDIVAGLASCRTWTV